MHEYFQIKETILPLLEQFNFVEQFENNQVDHFGSIETMFVSEKMSIKLSWDGEGGFGYAEVWKNGIWNKLSTKVFEAKVSDFENFIKQLKDEIKSYL